MSYIELATGLKSFEPYLYCFIGNLICNVTCCTYSSIPLTPLFFSPIWWMIVSFFALLRVFLFVQKHCGPVIKGLHSSPDRAEEYNIEYGYLGPLLCHHVIKLREAEAHKAKLLASAGLSRPSVCVQ